MKIILSDLVRKPGYAISYGETAVTRILDKNFLIPYLYKKRAAL